MASRGRSFGSTWQAGSPPSGVRQVGGHAVVMLRLRAAQSGGPVKAAYVPGQGADL